MKITITDGYTLNPGDLSWSTLSKFGDIVYYDRTAPSEAIGRCRDAEILIVNKTIISKEVISAATNLKMIAVAATGFNCIDIQAATERHIPVCNVPVYGTYSVAQHTIALLLELANHAGSYTDAIKMGQWSASKDWCYTNFPIIELYGKTLGIIGFGRIGRRTAAIARSLGMRVIHYSRSADINAKGYRPLYRLLAESDFVSLHCPLTPENAGFVNKTMLSEMRPGAYLINTSRGQLINERELSDALRAKIIAGAALDVLSTEPPPKDHPLIGLSNCILTPHNAWKSIEARRRIMLTTVENITAALQGKPINVVNRLNEK